MSISKAVLPAAGLGTRLLPITKETPKEMLPIYMRGRNGDLYMKPMLQAVFEQLYANGFREFILIVGRTKRAIEDHFTKDASFIEDLYRSGRKKLAEEMEDFYDKVESSSLVFVNQPEPKGFGDAVLRAKPFISGQFLVHAGDTYIISNEDNHIKRLLEVNKKSRSEATFISQTVIDPMKYGVAKTGGALGRDGISVTEVVEKPPKPETNLAMMPIYIFSQSIFRSLEEIEPGVGGEIQLTDGIQKLIEKGLRVSTVSLDDEDVRLDIGDPEMFWEAQVASHEFSMKA